MQKTVDSSKDHRYEYPTGGDKKVDEDENTFRRSYTGLETDGNGIAVSEQNIIRDAFHHRNPFPHN